MSTTAIKATYGADTTELAEKNSQAISLVQVFADKVGNLSTMLKDGLGEVGASLLKGFVISDVAGKILGWLSDIKEKAQRLTNLSRELGVSTDALQLFEKAAVKAGASTEAAQKTWEKARKSLSDLADGNEAATKNFETLHLTARDFIGLSLDQALEKIARAYMQNRDELGAYAALTEILGARQAPQLMAALQRLGTEGFGGLSASAENLGDKILPANIEALDALTRAGGKVSGMFKNMIGNIAGGLLNLPEILGTAAASLTNWVRGVETDWDSVGLLQDKATKKLEEFNAKALAAAEAQRKAEQDKKVQLDESTAAYLEFAKAQQVGLTGQQKINALADEYTRLQLAAGSSLLTQGERQAAQAELAKVRIEYEKAIADEQKRQTAEGEKALKQYDDLMFKVAEIGRRKMLEGLPAEERVNVLLGERAKLLATRSGYEKTSVDYLQYTVQLDALDRDIAKEKLVVLKQQGDEQKRIADEARRAAAAAQLEKEAKDSFLGRVRGHSDFANADEATLKAIIARDRDLAKQAYDPLNLGSGLNAAGVAAGFFAQKSQAATYLADAAAAQQELDLRAKIRSAGSYEAALAQYGGDPLNFRALYDQATKGLDANTRTATATEAIAKKLGGL